jgi:hypothetical protein
MTPFIERGNSLGGDRIKPIRELSTIGYLFLSPIGGVSFLWRGTLILTFGPPIASLQSFQLQLCSKSRVASFFFSADSSHCLLYSLAVASASSNHKMVSPRCSEHDPQACITADESTPTQASESRLYTFSGETREHLRKFRLTTSRAQGPQAVICA